MKKTKTDYRIMGRPYRGARHFHAMVTGLTKTKAERKLKQGLKEGWLSFDAYVRSQVVGAEFIGEDHVPRAGDRD